MSTTSKELSQQLQDAGYMGPHKYVYDKNTGRKYRLIDLAYEPGYDAYIPAYTTSELLFAMPLYIVDDNATLWFTLSKGPCPELNLNFCEGNGEIDINCEKCMGNQKDYYSATYGDDLEVFAHENPAEALGQLKLWVIENGMEVGE